MGTHFFIQTALRPFLFFWIAILSGFTACIEPGVPQAAKEAIENIEQQYAPDRRVAVFDIKLHRQNDTLILSGETNLTAAHRVLLQQLGQLHLPYSDQVEILPSPTLDGQTHGVVNVSVANIRSAPKHSAELATQSILGAGLKIYKKEGDWYYVQTPDQYLGWLDGGALVVMNEQQYADWLQAEKVIFLADYGFALEAASAQGARLSDLVAGNILTDGGPEGAFRAVVYPDGRRAYVNGPEVMSLPSWLKSKSELSTPAILQTAMAYMGRPYLWGGTSGKGMDCSGFTKTVYFMNGIVLPRDASQQVQAGVAVPADSSLHTLAPGDFLFFGEAATPDGQKEKVRHVGIYLGEGRFIHSGADNPGVRIESLLPGTAGYAPHRRETFLQARRMESGSPGVIHIDDLPDFYGEIHPGAQLMQ